MYCWLCVCSLSPCEWKNLKSGSLDMCLLSLVIKVSSWEVTHESYSAFKYIVAWLLEILESWYSESFSKIMSDTHPHLQVLELKAYTTMPCLLYFFWLWIDHVEIHKTLAMSSSSSSFAFFPFSFSSFPQPLTPFSSSRCPGTLTSELHLRPARPIIYLSFRYDPFPSSLLILGRPVCLSFIFGWILVFWTFVTCVSAESKSQSVLI